MQTRKLPPLQIVTDPVRSAKAVGLRYVSDETPGLRRLKSGKSFRYIDAKGKPVRQDDLRRIKSLVIPPAWTDVWICPVENGHLQATGHDVKGRKQYRYHPRWREVRDETKYNRMVEFAKALPRIRQRIQRDMKLPGLPKQKVLATVVRLLEVSLIRIGNEEYARENNSFGLTTMRDRHVDVSGSTLRFHFRGKAGKQHDVQVDDPRLARIVKRCQDLPGQELFQYLDDDGNRQTVGSDDVNVYLKEITGQEFSAKDFRTWAGTVLAARALQELEEVDSQAKAKKNIVRAVEAVSQMLGNTPSICRKCYVHPAVLQAYLDGALLTTLRNRADEKIATSLARLRPEEAAVLAFLQRRLVQEERERNGVKKLSGAANLLHAGRKAARVKAGRGKDALPSAWRS
jgi:DNA topoisomerase-1